MYIFFGAMAAGIWCMFTGFWLGPQRAEVWDPKLMRSVKKRWIW